jgi:hypothetical protein
MNAEHNDRGVFRFVIGLIALATAVGGFAALFVVRVPPENKDAMMFALGAVFGWATSVIASEYGSTATGRKVAESAVRQMERQTIAGESTAQVEVMNDTANPVPTTESKP